MHFIGSVCYINNEEKTNKFFFSFLKIKCYRLAVIVRVSIDFTSTKFSLNHSSLWTNFNLLAFYLEFNKSNVNYDHC